MTGHVESIPSSRGRVALHELSSGEGAGGLGLLLLHPLGASSEFWRARAPRWPGPIHALDFVGHGQSPPTEGRDYLPELLCADADAALVALGSPRVVAGAGLGAYIALLLAGVRSEDVVAALLEPGEGLAGAGPEPVHPQVVAEPAPCGEPVPVPDPIAIERLEASIRPPRYALDFSRHAQRLVMTGEPKQPTPWWDAVAEGPNAERAQGGWQPALDALSLA